MLGTDKGSADFAELVRGSQKFYCGDVGMLDGIASPNEFPKLPYPMCMFEFEDLDPAGVKRPFFLLAEEIGDSEPGCNSVRVHPFICYPMPGKADHLWMHSGWIEVNRDVNKYDSFANKNTLKFLDGGDGFARLADKEAIGESMLAAAQWLCRFLSVLNCSNVQINEVLAPEALNKKRLSKGKVPIYTYKTLVLKTRQQRLVSSGYGTHESPRIHLRRGHIKRRKTGNFWWQPCVVGDRKRGVVMKDYELKGTR